MNAALEWLILMGLYSTGLDKNLEDLEYRSSRWILDKNAGWHLGNKLYRTWYCYQVAIGFLK